MILFYLLYFIEPFYFYQYKNECTLHDIYFGGIALYSLLFPYFTYIDRDNKQISIIK